MLYALHEGTAGATLLVRPLVPCPVCRAVWWRMSLPPALEPRAWYLERKLGRCSLTKGAEPSRGLVREQDCCPAGAQPLVLPACPASLCSPMEGPGGRVWHLDTWAPSVGNQVSVPTA